MTTFLQVVDQEALSNLLSTEHDEKIQIRSSTYLWQPSRCIHDQLSSILKNTTSLNALNFMEQHYVQMSGSLPLPKLWNVDRFLGAAGLNSVVHWGMPFQNLSSGQQARAESALALIRIAQQFYVQMNGTTPAPHVVFVLEKFDTLLDDATALSLSIGFGKAIRLIRGSHTTCNTSLMRISVVVGVVRKHLKCYLLGNETSSKTKTKSETKSETKTSTNYSTKYFDIVFKSNPSMELHTKQANIAADQKHSPVPPIHAASLLAGVSSLTLTCNVANAKVTASSLLPFGITWNGMNQENILYPSEPDPKKPVTVLFGPSGCGKTSILHETCIKVVCGGDDSSAEDERNRIATTMGNDVGIDEFGSFQQISRENFAHWFMDMVEEKKLERISVTTLDLNVARVLLSRGARVWDVFRSRWLQAAESSSSSASFSLSTQMIQMHKQHYKIIEVNGEDWWQHFSQYHYMEHQGDGNIHGGFNNVARTFLLLNEDVAIGLCATLPGMGIYQLGSVVREHRTVILPPYQGMGIGQTFVKVIAENYMRSGIGFFSRTKHPALVDVRNRDAKWRTIQNTAGKRDSSGNVAYSHFYVGNSTIRSFLIRDIVHTNKIHDVEKALNLLQKLLVGFSSNANSLKGCKELLKKDHTRFFDVPVSKNCNCLLQNSSMEDIKEGTENKICNKCSALIINILEGVYVSRLFKPQDMWWKTGKKKPEQ